MTRVLLVDDHAPTRARIRRLLEAEGFTVVAEAGDGRSAVEVSATTPMDMAIVDIGLPDLDGFAVASALHERASTMPVVLTSSREDVDLARVAGSGARGFLPKELLSVATLRRLVGLEAP